jgi:hypothetical protein
LNTCYFSEEKSTDTVYIKQFKQKKENLGNTKVKFFGLGIDFSLAGKPRNKTFAIIDFSCTCKIFSKMYLASASVTLKLYFKISSINFVIHPKCFHVIFSIITIFILLTLSETTNITYFATSQSATILFIVAMINNTYVQCSRIFCIHRWSTIVRQINFWKLFRN